MVFKISISFKIKISFKVVVTFNDDKVEAQMDVAVVKKLKSEISAVKKDITKNVREDKKLQSDLRREKEKRTFEFYLRIKFKLTILLIY